MSFLEIIKALSPLIVGLAAPFVTLKIWKSENKEKKDEKAERKKDEYDTSQNERIDGLEREVRELTKAVAQVVEKTNENTELNHRLINGMGVLIDSGEINGTINGPGKKWLRETQSYCINRGFEKIEFESLSEKKKAKK